MDAAAVHLQPVTPADEGVLLAIYAATRADEVALTGWNATTAAAFVRMQFDAQSTHYRQSHPAAQHALVVVGAHPAGRLWVDRSETALHVLDIALLPAWRGLGIGGLCLQRLLDEAAADGKTVTIHVETGNPARRLYERLGFAAQGPVRGIHQLMVWRAAATGQADTSEEPCHEQA